MALFDRLKMSSPPSSPATVTQIGTYPEEIFAGFKDSPGASLLLRRFLDLVFGS